MKGVPASAGKQLQSIKGKKPNIEVDQLTDTNDRDDIYNETISDNIITSRNDITMSAKGSSFHKQRHSVKSGSSQNKKAASKLQQA
jgi:hypothetical protein